VNTGASVRTMLVSQTEGRPTDRPHHCRGRRHDQSFRFGLGNVVKRRCKNTAQVIADLRLPFRSPAVHSKNLMPNRIVGTFAPWITRPKAP
jgi:hypothetical protein